jgi:hypothetical protein
MSAAWPGRPAAVVQPSVLRGGRAAAPPPVVSGSGCSAPADLQGPRLLLKRQQQLVLLGDLVALKGSLWARPHGTSARQPRRLWQARALLIARRKYP